MSSTEGQEKAKQRFKANMPLINKVPFTPDPIPENLGPDDEVFYLDLTNEIFTSHDAFFDRFLFCNSLIWTCARTGKSGLTYKEALDSEQQEPVKRKKGKRKKEETTNSLAEVDGGNGGIGDDGSAGGVNESGEPVKKKKKKYPYDPKKYAMPVPEGFDPSLLTPTGKIDGRKLKSKKNKQIADELLSSNQHLAAQQQSDSSTPGRKGKHKRKEDDIKRKEDEVKKKEEEAKKKAQLQAELARERELEAKKKKEAAALAKQQERQKREEERKKAAAFLQNWEKKCEDLDRDDLRRLPQPTPLSCDIPDRLFGDAIFIMESLYNLHELFEFNTLYPEGSLSFDTLEEVLFERQEDGPLGALIQFLLRIIVDTQPTPGGYGLDDDPSKIEAAQAKTENAKAQARDESTDIEDNQEHETNGLGSEADADEDDNDENEDKEVKMNDLIGSAIKAAQEVRKSLSKPISEMELNSATVTEVLRLHLLQSGSFPKGRTIYNGWYSSREDPGLWLCMQEPDLIKKLGEVSIYGLDIEERIKILHTLIYQLFSFIRTRNYIESASEKLTEIRKEYRKKAADFARWDRENCVKRMQPPKRKGEHDDHHSSEKSIGPGNPDGQEDMKSEQILVSNPASINGDANENDCDHLMVGNAKVERESNNNQHLKSCLKTNGTSGTSSDAPPIDSEELPQSKKKITFKTSMNGATEENGHADDEDHDGKNQVESYSEQTFEEQERVYHQNLVDYEDYQRERAIRLEELNSELLILRNTLRLNQSVYGVHPIGRDRAFRRYWLFQSLPGLFVEQDDEYVGKCLPNPTPLESRYKKLFNKDNPLMHPDLIQTADHIEQQQQQQPQQQPQQLPEQQPNQTTDTNSTSNNTNNNNSNHNSADICTGDANTCAVHGLERPSEARWWFYHKPESIDHLIESLNKRGHRESELLESLSGEISIIKTYVANCPAFLLNKSILEQSGIRRSRRIGVGKKKRSRKYEID